MEIQTITLKGKPVRITTYDGTSFVSEEDFVNALGLPPGLEILTAQLSQEIEGISFIPAPHIVQLGIVLPAMSENMKSFQADVIGYGYHKYSSIEEDVMTTQIRQQLSARMNDQLTLQASILKDQSVLQARIDDLKELSSGDEQRKAEAKRDKLNDKIKGLDAELKDLRRSDPANESKERQAKKKELTKAVSELNAVMESLKELPGRIASSAQQTVITNQQKKDVDQQLASVNAEIDRIKSQQDSLPGLQDSTELLLTSIFG